MHFSENGYCHHTLTGQGPLLKTLTNMGQPSLGWRVEERAWGPSTRALSAPPPGSRLRQRSWGAKRNSSHVCYLPSNFLSPLLFIEEKGRLAYKEHQIAYFKSTVIFRTGICCYFTGLANAWCMREAFMTNVRRYYLLTFFASNASTFTLIPLQACGLSYFGQK